MVLLNKVVPGNEAVPSGRLRTGGGENIKEGFRAGEPNDVSDGKGDGRNQGVFLYSDQRSTARRVTQ